MFTFCDWSRPGHTGARTLKLAMCTPSKNLWRGITSQTLIFKKVTIKEWNMNKLTASIKTRPPKKFLPWEKRSTEHNRIFRLLPLHAILLPAGQFLLGYTVLATILGITLGSVSDTLSVTINNSSSTVSTATE